MLGIERFCRLRDGFLVDFDVNSLEVYKLQSLLKAAFSRVSYGVGDYPSSTHILPVTFGGSAGPDMSIVCLLLDTPEPTLIRRVCRSKHIVRSFLGPGASALLEVPWVEAWQNHAQPRRTAQGVPAGSLTLSPLGATLISRSCYTDDFVVARTNPGLHKSFPEILIGDSVWLRSGRR